MRRLLRRLRGFDPRECEEIRELMSDYVDDQLDADGQSRVDAHLGRCPRCHQVLDNLRATLGRVRALGAREPADADSAAGRIAAGWRDRT